MKHGSSSKKIWYKPYPVYCLCVAGIQHAIGGLASKPERDLLMQDFMTVETTNFPHEGSNHTPAHHYSEFKFKTYAPIAFRYFRDLFGIQPDDFLVSVVYVVWTIVESSPIRETTAVLSVIFPSSNLQILLCSGSYRKMVKNTNISFFIKKIGTFGLFHNTEWHCVFKCKDGIA